MPQIESFQPIEWQESMAIGIDAIDEQHRYLFDTLNAANDRLRGNHDDLLLSQFINDLLGYAITHFKTEEALMQRYDYAKACPAEAETHIAQHRFFSRRIVAALDQLREGKAVSRAELLSFLNNWLHDHVLGTDQKMARYLIMKIGRDA
ncbi:MAG: bacteriohemerythrin [Candidatus Thiodiazotropha sp.]